MLTQTPPHDPVFLHTFQLDQHRPSEGRHVYIIIACPRSAVNVSDLERSLFELKQKHSSHEWMLFHATQTDQTIYLEFYCLKGDHVDDLLNDSERSLKGEVIVTAPCQIPLIHMSLNDLKCSLDHLDHAYCLFKENGIIHFKKAVQESERKSLRLLVHERIQEAQTLDASYDPSNEHVAYSEWASRGKRRFDLLFDLERNDHRLGVLRHLTEQGPWMPLIRKILKRDSVKCMVSVVYSLPGATTQSWHADGGHYGKEAYAVCIFVPLIDLNVSVGYTEFWPGSHEHKGLIGFGAAAELLEGTVHAVGDEGDAILYDYRLMHRGMANTSDQLRPILQFVYHVPWYTETKNYGDKALFM
jgi:hypothetical protein